MRKSIVLMAALLVAGAATEARAQLGQPLGGRLSVSINGGAQPAGQDLNRTSSFDLYGEPAEVAADQRIGGSSLFDIGAAYRVTRQYGIGLVYNHLSRTDSGTLSGSLPHPLFFDAPRAFSVGIDGLQHRERAVHLQAVYYYPFVENVDFTFSAGPSFFTVTQGFARGISFSENPPAFDTITVDAVDVARLEESAVGFNIGADMTYTFTENLGAGVLLRFTRATADFTLGEGQSASVRAGGFQIGAGLRLRF